MRVLIRTVLTGAVALIAVGASRPAHAQRISGTYELALCRTAPCVPGDTVAAYFTATVVLLDSATAAAQSVLPRARYEREPANGCFRVRHYQRLADSYAGIVKASSFTWQPLGESPGTIAFRLYRSPDASYRVRTTVIGDRLTGSGTSDGVGAAEMHAPRDTVVAVRVAEADVARCGDLSRRPGRRL